MITAEELVVELNSGKGEEESCFRLGTVVELFDNETAKVQFDGEDTPSEKQYAYLDWYIPEIGDRVLLGILSGTYIILGKVNYNAPPSKEEEIDRYLFDLKQVIMLKGLSVTGNTDLESLTVNDVAVDGDLSVSGEVMAQNISASGQLSGGTASVGQLDVSTSAHIAGQMQSGSIDSSDATLGTAVVRSTFRTEGIFRHTGGNLGFFGAAASTKRSVNNISNTSTATTEAVANKVNEIINALRWYGLLGGY
jgi:hypothetical protein